MKIKKNWVEAEQLKNMHHFLYHHKQINHSAPKVGCRNGNIFNMTNVSFPVSICQKNLSFPAFILLRDSHKRYFNHLDVQQLQYILSSTKLKVYIESRVYPYL